MASPPARNRALRAAAGGGTDAEAVVAKARALGVMGWVRPTGEIHAEGAPDALTELMTFVGDAVATERAPDGLAGKAHRLGDRPFRDPGAQHDAPAERRDAGQLGRRRGGVGREDHAEDRQHHVGFAVTERERGGLAGRERHVQPQRRGARPRDLEQPHGRVDAHHSGAALGGQERGVAGAGPDVDDALAGGGCGVLDDDARRRLELPRGALVRAQAPVEGGGGHDRTRLQKPANFSSLAASVTSERRASSRR